MHGLVSLLPDEYYRKVEDIWQMLEEECGLTGIKVTPFPHFSWLIASDFDWGALKRKMEEIASQTRPFNVQTGGIGLFSGPSPVIFIPVVRTDELNRLHRRVWDAIQPIGVEISPFYAPQYWMPHISLGYQDVTNKNIDCAMQELAFRTFNWKFDADNISFIHEPDGEIGKLFYQYKFKGE